MSAFLTNPTESTEVFSKAGVMLEKTDRPLCVDLDGTLLATDSLWESLVLLLRIAPLMCLALPYWLCQAH